jgi:hypothetical protein
MLVRLTQLDGALPNLALMKLAHYHQSKGDEVHLYRSVERDLFEPEWDIVYGSAIFKFSQVRLMRFMRQFPNAIVGGTGTHSAQTVEELIGDYEYYDYSIYPEVDYSIGFTQRGCRLKCKFCVVPTKEGKNRPAGSIWNIYRGEPHPRKLHLLDNDLFGNPEWRDRIKEIREGDFKVCISQGINTRLIDDESAEALATIKYRDTKFSEKRLYTAWDNLKDEGVFFKGVDTLERAGIKPSNLMTYMLVGYDKSETWERIWHRFNRMVERGIKPYPMVYDRSRKDLVAFQRWVVMGLYRIIPWAEYESKHKTEESILEVA